MSGSRKQYVVVPATAPDRVIESQVIARGNVDECVAARARLISQAAPPPNLVIRWAGSDGYLYVDRDGSPD